MIEVRSFGVSQDVHSASGIVEISVSFNPDPFNFGFQLRRVIVVEDNDSVLALWIV